MFTGMGGPGGAQWQRKWLRASAYSRAGDRLVAAVEELLGEELDERLERLKLAKNEAGFDPFGFDPRVARYVLAVAALVHRFYFRVETQGLENVVHGRALFVGNHSGQLPIDGMMLVTTLMLELDPPVLARSMVERWTAELPFLSIFFPRVGQVLGSPDNARGLLEQEQPLMVFPEGVRGISKPYSERYQLQAFGGGFMRLALETHAPIVPVAVIGAEEQYPSVANLSGLARRLGIPGLPLMPQLLLGFLAPLPVRYRVRFGEPMRFEGDADDEDEVIASHVEQVRGRIDTMLKEGLAARENVFW